ncbi:MAG: NAD(P)/FAD-dependent oxidoreductase [Chitinophagales bacterium]|nr:NAD(P)/FAD-dependent oxidoreductase [Chitinophagales bacterium]
MKTGVSYKQEPVTGQYDAIIIGSGMGALTTAALLSKQGKKVLVLERHYTAGGFTHMFKRNDYEWDVGVHYVGEVMDKRTALAIMFDYITDGKLEWADMGEVYDRIIFGDKEYQLVKGKERLRQQLKDYFPAPADQTAIDQYFALLDASAKSAQGFFMDKALPKLVSGLIGGFMKRPFYKFSDKTTLQTLQEITQNKELIGLLTSQYGDYGMEPSRGSFSIHAMVAKHYLKGGAYPVGGCTSIAACIEPIIEKAGGKIYTNAEVAEILVKDNKAIGVKMKDGKEIHAPMVISSAGVHNTFERLLPLEVATKNGLLSTIANVKPSAAHISLYIGLKHTAEELNLPKANYWIYPSYDHDENMRRFLADDSAPFPVVYISFPSAKDPDFGNRYPGKATIEIITFAPFEKFAQWDGTRWKKRGEDYEAYKENIAQKLLQHLYEREPQVKDKIDFYELSTPLSTKHFVNYQHGEIYGLEHTPERFRLKNLRPQTPIKNLYLTGQDIVTVGIGGALFSGVLTASAIMGKNLLGDIIKKGREAAAH